MTDFETEFARRNELSHALAMAHCLQDHIVHMRETAETSLVRNLPSLRAEDAEWINREQVWALIQSLDATRPNIAIAILDALGRVGDRRARPYVQELVYTVGRRPETNSPEAAAVLNAASVCLVRLQEHATRAKQSDLLLRGSKKPRISAESTLLRASVKSVDSPAAELLRADCAGAEVTRKEDYDDSSP